MGGLGNLTELPSTDGARQGGLCSVGLSSQCQYPLPRPKQQLVRGMSPRQTDDQPPGVPHHPARKGDQGEANCLEALALPLSANTSRFIAELRLKVSTAIAHHAALAPNSPDGSLPAAKALFRTRWTSSPLPHLCLAHRINSSPARSRLVATPKSLFHPPLASLIVGKGSSSCASIPGRGCSFSGSLMAMNNPCRNLSSPSVRYRSTKIRSLSE